MNKQPIQFGRYQLQERLAVGGMAELYRAVLNGPSGFSKPVVIKKIIGDLASRSQFRKMFEHEGRIMAALSHRNLVQVFELGEVDSELFLCMEYVSGCDLAEVLREHRLHKRFLSPALTAWIGREICQGLEFVHTLTDEAGRPLAIVHRDVNPHNILLSEHGDVKLADFGIAKSMIREVRTMIGQVKGKLQYLAPEQANAESVGPATDIYAVGLILFEMLTAQRYIQGSVQNDWLENASNPTWRSICEINPDVPELLENIVQRALRNEPEKRFGTARAMAQVLSQVIEAAKRAPSAYDVARLVTSVRGLDCDEHSSVTMPVNNPMLKIDSETWEKKLPAPPVMSREDSENEAENPLTISLVSNTTNKYQQRRQWILVGLASLVLLFIWVVGFPDWFRHSDIRKPSQSRARNKNRSKGALKTDSSTRNTPVVAHSKPKSNTKPSAPAKSNSQPQSSQKNPSPVAAKTPLSQLQTELEHQQNRLNQRGIRQADNPRLDRLIKNCNASLASKNFQVAKNQIRKIESTIDKLEINRNFIEQKLQRLKNTLRINKREAKYAKEIRRALEHAANHRYIQANASINLIFDKLNRTR